jgi:hypothetical protein
MHVNYSVVHPIIHCQFYLFSNLFYSLNEFAGTIPQFCNFFLFYSSIISAFVYHFLLYCGQNTKYYMSYL